MTAQDFWDKVKQLLADQGKTFVWLCEQAGVSVQVMKNRIYKNRIPDVDETLKLLSVLGVTVEELFGVKSPASNPDFSLTGQKFTLNDQKIPVYEQFSSCGFGQYVPDSQTVENYIEIPEELKGKRLTGHLAASKIRGDSMEPTISNGDTIICDNRGFNEDGIYVVIYQGKGFVKRLQSVSEGVKITSDNPVYEPVLVQKDSVDLRVIGQVHYVLHKL